MAIDFPNSPALNEVFTLDTKQWQYDGQKWVLISAGVIGATGPAGVDGKTILSGPTGPYGNPGNNGDFYIDFSQKELWGPKAAGAWPLTSIKLVGPTGSVGPLDTLSDVVVPSPTTNNILKYDGTNWVNGTVPLATPSVPGALYGRQEVGSTYIYAYSGAAVQFSANPTTRTISVIGSNWETAFSQSFGSFFQYKLFVGRYIQIVSSSSDYAITSIYRGNILSATTDTIIFEETNFSIENDSSVFVNVPRILSISSSESGTNLSIGHESLSLMGPSTTGNIGIGWNALKSKATGTPVFTGSYNIALGYNSGTQLPSSTAASVIIGGHSGSGITNGEIVLSDGNGGLKAKYAQNGTMYLPGQPTYNGDNTGGPAIAFNGEVVKPLNTYINNTSWFNTTTGRFTVQNAGYVFCSFNSLITRNLNTSHAYVEFQVNGVRKSVRNHTMYDIGGSYTNLSNSAIVYCTAGSYVTCNLWTPQASSYGDQYGLGLTFRFLG